VALLIDTSVFVALERRGLPLGALAAAAPGGPDAPVALAGITASELLVGVHRADTPARRLRRGAFVEALLGAVPVLPFDLRLARTPARLWAQLAAAGTTVGAHDLLVGATALAHGYAVLTDDPRDIGRVPGLEVLRPGW
jgi:predicted nucleic acid-binding protein